MPHFLDALNSWVTDELKKALEKGYVVQRIYEVWQFDETEQYDPKTKTGGLFTDYVNTFFKMKQEASCWPEWCQSENDKWRYIRDYHETILSPMLSSIRP
jgi:hypothetical protein